MIFRRSTEVYNPVVARALTNDVFGFLPQTTIPQPVEAAIFYHWEALKLNNQQLQENNPNLRGIENICSLIRVLKDERQKTIQELYNHLAANPPPVTWISANTSEAAVDDALQFTLHLWLFAEPSLKDKSITLQQAVHNSLESIKTPSNKWLWEDFSADTLKITAGFRFIYTHNLAEHLTFASRDEIKIFCHTKVLKRYAESFTAESKWYPSGLLDDFDRTMNLLWPLEEPKVPRQVKKLQEKHYVDLEASMGQVNKFDLRTYPFFGDRLAKIQERLEVDEQRQKTTTAFKIAVWGILLTAFFGLVSAATGLVSMWAGLRQVSVV